MVLTDTTYFLQGSSVVKNAKTCLSRDTSKAKPDRDGVGWGGLAQCLTAQCSFNNTILCGVICSVSVDSPDQNEDYSLL